ncbi:SNF2 helicase associated domain-containing protein [Candidatus Pacearchaeota archaeon]|nr:SNF2 helicase associated domain-containing protein [Candidatus Pacearchaeota archaeon]
MRFTKIAKVNKSDIKKKLIKLGVKEELVPVFDSFVNNKFQAEALDIFKKLEISKERINTKNESNILIRWRNRSYDVSIEIINDEMFHYCTCPHRSEAKACSHAGATLIYKMLRNEKNEFNSKPKTLMKAQETNKKNQGGITYFKELFPTVKKEAQKNVIYFNFEDFDENGQNLALQRGIIKKDGEHSLPMKLTGKDFSFSKLKVNKKVKEVLSFIITGDNLREGYSTGGFSKSRFYDVNTDMMMPLLKEIYFDEQELILGATFAEDNFHVAWETKLNDDGDYTVKPYFVSGKRKVDLLKMQITELGLNSLWVFDNKTRCFYQHKESLNLEAVKNIIRFPKELTLSESELREFFERYYQQMLDSFEFNVGDDFKREEKSVIPKPKLYMERDGKNVRIALRFDYAGREIDYFSANKELVIVETDIIYDVSRDLEEEDRIAELLNEHDVVTHGRYDEFKIKGDLVDFVVYEIPAINEMGIEILGEENLFNFKIAKGKVGMMMEVRNDVDWFDIKGEVRFGKDKIGMGKVLESVFQNKRFVDLGDGKKGVIPKNWINELRAYRGFFTAGKEGGVKLNKYHMPVLESLISLSKKSELDLAVKKIVSKFKNFEKIKSTKLSPNLNATLREYQKDGYDWLNFLRDFEFNGILADDMGLGKTVQTLSILQKIKDEEKNKKFLVIVPTSLVFNWRNEIEKFTPGIKPYLHHGVSRAKGEKKFDKMIEDHDLIITTYGVLKNDLALFVNREFEYIILDEAHTIKNPLSVNARTVGALNGKRKLAISGTPIQNNLIELWSLFEFLSPGYLGTYDGFKENFVIPIEKDKDKNATANLKKMIDPFLLRRNKSNIATELPDKTEIVLKSDFNDDEAVIYQTWKDHYSSEINRSIKDKGINKSRLKILEGLTKLRQVCLHPKMVDPEYMGSSAKFDLLMMEVEKVLKEGHKVLIFSSFVKMLNIVKEEFEHKGIKYSYLDGSSINRERIVGEFQNSKEARPFLISIKAGGVGINLTSADYVFIIDPWWNPAVEMQAMDRAHRIGQKNPVFVYKMIANKSIEEKILELQRSKKKLVEDVISVEEGGVKAIDAKAIKEIFG